MTRFLLEDLFDQIEKEHHFELARNPDAIEEPLEYGSRKQPRSC